MYPTGIFIGSKSGKNIQKKCALFSEQGFVKLIGFESSRRHLSAIAKEAQEKVLYYILKEDAVGKAILYVRNTIADVKHNVVPLRKTIIYTQLQKDIMKYETIAPHVAVAQHMQQHGFTIAPGLIVKYIVSAGDGSIAERAKLPNEVDSYDADYYVDNQIIPAVEKIFEAVGIDILKELEEKEQSNLAEYI
jgi:DNA polymerase I